MKVIQPHIRKINTTAIIIILAFLLLIAIVFVYYNLQSKQIDLNIEKARQQSQSAIKAKTIY